MANIEVGDEYLPEYDVVPTVVVGLLHSGHSEIVCTAICGKGELGEVRVNNGFDMRSRHNLARHLRMLADGLETFIGEDMVSEVNG